MKIGVLALQGAFAEHINALSQLGIETIPISLPSQLDSIDGLIIPGGESTTIGKLMIQYRLTEPIRKLASRGVPIFGTCAGMILLAKKVIGLNLETLSLMDIEVKRNAFGRQRESFEADLTIPVLGDKSFRGIFIRAPLVEETGHNVEVLSRLDNNTIVAVKQGK